LKVFSELDIDKDELLKLDDIELLNQERAFEINTKLEEILKDMKGKKKKAAEPSAKKSTKGDLDLIKNKLVECFEVSFCINIIYLYRKQKSEEMKHFYF
jgi:hypothetical protein